MGFIEHYEHSNSSCQFIIDDILAWGDIHFDKLVQSNKVGGYGCHGTIQDAELHFEMEHKNIKCIKSPHPLRQVIGVSYLT